jgi:hypothetical protein
LRYRRGALKIGDELLVHKLAGYDPRQSHVIGLPQAFAFLQLPDQLVHRASFEQTCFF